MARVTFSPEELAALDQAGRRVQYRAREFCYLQGDPGDSVFVLRSGRVRVSRITNDGREFTLAYLKPGEPFGELALVDGAPRETVAEAVEDSEVTVVRVDDLEALLAERPALAIKFAKLLGQRNKVMADKVEDLVFRDVPARLAGLLLTLASDFGVGGERGTRFPFKITHRELAACIGSSRETVSQTLTLFARDRLIARSGRQIIITAPDGLSRLVGRGSPSGGER
ncbi:MAG TPA: Crp/Fnr family transcriptional regulator [Thermodesulfobacteriota bacterium]